MPALHPDPRVARVVAFYERLTPDSLGTLAEVYAPGARFKDPFNEVQGLDAIRAIFTHMFQQVQAPRFVVLTAVAEDAQCFLTWDFHFQTGDKALTIHGASHLRFDGGGRVAWHRDYWDAAEELYEKLPVLGSLMRWLKRRASR